MKAKKLPTSMMLHRSPKMGRKRYNQRNYTSLADDIMCRYLKYGKLDSTGKIAKRTGASTRQELSEKDINYYDQDDPFIDDGEVPEHNHGQKMFLPNVQLSDFNCVQGNLKVLAQSQQYHERMELINSFNKNLEKNSDSKPSQENKQSTKHHKNKKIKPNNPQSTPKSANSLNQQDSLFLQDLFIKMGSKKEEGKKNPTKKIQKRTDKTAKQSVQLYQQEPMMMVMPAQMIDQMNFLPAFLPDQQDLAQLLSSIAQSQVLMQQIKKTGQHVEEAIQIDGEDFDE